MPRFMWALSDNKVDDKDDEAEEHEAAADPLVHLAVHSGGACCRSTYSVTGRGSENTTPQLTPVTLQLPEGILPAGGDPVVQLLRAGQLLLTVRPRPVERFLVESM